jgi:hypothetical protein
MTIFRTFNFRANSEPNVKDLYKSLAIWTSWFGLRALVGPKSYHSTNNEHIVVAKILNNPYPGKEAKYDDQK